MKKLFLSCVALALMASPALAADAAKAAPAPAVAAPHDHKGVFEQADANNDGIVTRDEFLASEGKYFDSVDTNHDGKLSKDEIQAQRQAAQARRMAWRAGHDKTAPAAAVQK